MNLRTITRTVLILIGAFIAVAIGDIFFLPGSFGWITALTTLTSFTFAVLHGGQRLGWRNMFILLGVVFIVSIAFESVGVATGKIYGSYHYSDKLGPKFLGLVPYLMPAAWFMMMYSSLIIAEYTVPDLAGSKIRRFLWVAAVGGVVMTAWDLSMDPAMVAGGYWTWEIDGAYFGIPLQNYWGWWLTSFGCLLIYLAICNGRTHDVPFRKESIPDRWAIIAYALMGASTVVVDLSTGLTGPGLAGIFAMLPWFAIGWRLSSLAPAAP